MATCWSDGVGRVVLRVGDSVAYMSPSEVPDLCAVLSRSAMDAAVNMSALKAEKLLFEKGETAVIDKVIERGQRLKALRA